MLAVAAERAAFSTSREQRRRLTSGVVGGGGASPPSPPEAVVAAARAAAGRAPAMSAEDARVVVAQAEQLEVSEQSSRPPRPARRPPDPRRPCTGGAGEGGDAREAGRGEAAERADRGHEPAAGSGGGRAGAGRAERVNAGRADSGPRTRPLFIKKRATGTRSALASGQKDRGANDCRCTQSAKVGFTVQWPYSGLGTQLSAASLLLRHKRRIAWTARQDAAAALPHSASPPVLLRPALGPAAHAPVDLLPQGAARPLPACTSYISLRWGVSYRMIPSPTRRPPPSWPTSATDARSQPQTNGPSRAPTPCRGRRREPLRRAAGRRAARRRKPWPRPVRTVASESHQPTTPLAALARDASLPRAVARRREPLRRATRPCAVPRSIRCAARRRKPQQCAPQRLGPPQRRSRQPAAPLAAPLAALREPLRRAARPVRRAALRTLRRRASPPASCRPHPHPPNNICRESLRRRTPPWAPRRCHLVRRAARDGAAPRSTAQHRAASRSGRGPAPWPRCSLLPTTPPHRVVALRNAKSRVVSWRASCAARRRVARRRAAPRKS